MAIVEVSPGICGFTTRIVSTVDDMYNVTLEITSDCGHIRQLAEQLQQVSVFKELRLAAKDTETFQAAAEAKLHTACPVPVAVLKAIEVAADMALPADVHMAIRKE